MTAPSTGIVVALLPEAKALTAAAVRPDRPTPLGGGAALWLGGMGPAAARQAAHGLSDAGATALAVFGVAGALDVWLRSGTVLCPERVLDDGGDDYTPDARWRAELARRFASSSLPAPVGGALLSVREPLLAADSKKAAHDRHAAVAVDMESAAVAAVAKDRGLPFLVLRAIVDEAEDAVPAALHAGVDAWGRPRWLGLAGALARQPRLALQLPGLHSRMRRATRALRAAAAATGPALARPS